MENSVIFNSPILIVGFALALVLCVCALFRRAGRVATLLSAAVFVATATYALLLGAGLDEVGLVATAFFAVSVAAAWKGRDNR